MRKKFFVSVFIIVVLSICLLWLYYSSNFSSNTTTSFTTTTTTTTTVPTTLSEEEILKNHIKDINEDVIRGLKEKYNIFDTKYVGYVFFQDFIGGAKSNPSDYFFIGTESYELSQEYNNTKFYKNSDALNQLKEWNIIDADYFFVYLSTKKDAYGKEKEQPTYVVVQEKGDDDFTWWLFDCHDELSLGEMIMQVIVEKCNVNY